MSPRLYAEFRTEDALRAAVAIVSGVPGLHLDVFTP
jgi:hypothetical protein